MSPLEFQRLLREASNRLLSARDRWHSDVSRLFAEAARCAEDEPEMFSAIAQGEQARLARLFNEDPPKPSQSPLSLVVKK
ncbi:hypothetical protein [Frigidibacter oleivorans]|uniref:hypothetical protein n=1 Tax=Frigidibacter oleivorans TaxID=2487129 RepID=UPI000F8D678A|nr:hypothetical protein [Frigidibacter oleivorans]